MRHYLTTVLLLASLSGIADAQPPARPVLYVVHHDGCLPCRVFDRIFVTRRDVRDALARFELRELDMAIPAQNATAKRYGVNQIPTWLMMKDNRIVARHVGFVNTVNSLEVEPALQSLMIDLGVDWPARNPDANPAFPGTIAAPTPSGPTVDLFAREQIGQLRAETASLSISQLDTQQQVSQLQTSVAGAVLQISRTQEQLTASTDSLGEQIKSSHTQSKTELSKLTDRLKETIHQTVAKLPERSLPPATPPDPASGDRPDAAGLTLPPRGGDADTSDAGSRNATASSWISVASWAAKTAVTIAAPQIAIPATAGMTALGFGLSWLRRRRAARAGSGTTTVGQSVAVVRDTETRHQTANHYVVKEVDKGGEAYKEALRRTVAAYKSDRPGIVDVAGQIEHVAQELLRGQTVQARASQPRPGIWTDEDHN